jgi:hypothetical protein
MCSDASLTLLPMFKKLQLWMPLDEADKKADVPAGFCFGLGRVLPWKRKALLT